MQNLDGVSVKVADEVWLATALLQQENPYETDFSLTEIRDRAAAEGVHSGLRPGVYIHASTHCVANKPARPATYRMLFETSHGRRRLFRDGDPWDPSRTGKIVPNRDEIPDKYQWLLDWYGQWSNNMSRSAASSGGQVPFKKVGRFEGLLKLRGTWKSDESPDEFIRRMREDWD